MYQELLDVATAAARKSSMIILEAYGKAQSPREKGCANLVTETDFRSEKIILNCLKESYPDHAYLAEESGKIDSASDFLWIIDPLDGTTNFVHGYPSFAVSIGCMVKGIPTIGVVVELPINRIFTAVRGGGAFRDGNPIKVSSVLKLNQSLLVTGFGYEHGDVWETNMNLFKQFTDKTHGVRRVGSAAVDLCFVACGIFDGFWEFDLQPWDIAAGSIIVEEAGGKITSMENNSFSIYDKQILATNNNVHGEMLELINQNYTPSIT